MSLLDRLVFAGVSVMPRRLMWSVARRYVAGAELEQALERIRGLVENGFGTILDVLGEDVSERAGAQAAAAEYRRALAGLSGVDPTCAVSVKPTHLGLNLDLDLCAELLADLASRSAADGRRLRFEMEDHPTIDGTLEVFSRLRPEHPGLGCVLQSRLFRTADDVERLLAADLPLDVRLVKGIYLEPAEVAWTEAQEISDSYVRLATRLLDGGARVALATHDGDVAAACIQLLEERGLVVGPAETRGYEFECLMGVREDFAASLRDQGHPVRVYVPYGQDWHAYSVRRLRKNPQIARHIMRAVLRGG